MKIRGAVLSVWRKLSPLHSPFLCSWVLFYSVVSLSAEGFRNPPAGAFNLGRAGGRIAQVDDPSAIAQNPANLIDLTDPEFLFAPSLVYIEAEYHSPTGSVARTREPWKPLPNMFASLPFGAGKMAAGFGITTPFGLSNEWDPPLDSPIRYTAPYFTELKTININPTFALQIVPRLNLGLGLDVAWSQITFEQYLNPLLPGLKAKAKGDGWGWGGNVGLTWEIADGHRLAATYRSPLTVDYDGHFVTKHLPLPGAAATSRADFHSQIKFPTIVALGYGVQVTDTIRLETDLEWIQFSRFDSLPIKIGANPLAIPSSTINQDWKDTFTAGLGGDWRFHRDWVLRAGYQF